MDFMRVKKSHLPSSSQKSERDREGDRDERVIWLSLMAKVFFTRVRVFGAASAASSTIDGKYFCE